MILVLDAAASPAIVAFGFRVTETDPAGLADAVAELDLTGVTAVAVTCGPGSFTGLRAALSLAHGFALAAGLPLVPVTLAEAFREGWPTDERALWVALDSRRGRVFLDRGDGALAVNPADIVPPDGPVALAGDGAAAVAAALASHDVVVTGQSRLRPEQIEAAARHRLAGNLGPLAALPLYVDPPEATPAPVRPPPVTVRSP